MMNQEHFLEIFNEYKATENYKEREEQRVIVPLFKEIISEALTLVPFTNQVLTNLIQIFKYNCSDETFDKKLEALVLDEEKRESIWNRAMEHYVPGFTNAGKTGITKLNQEELNTVQNFLRDAFDVLTIQEAIDHVHQYELRNIPEVKSGIYSPWLFYINPTIFPIFNNSYKNFLSWYELPKAYENLIEPFHELKSLVEEEDFSHIDMVAHVFTKDGRLFFFKTLELNGKSIFKISHGSLFFDKNFENEPLIKVVNDHNWITLNRNIKKGQGEAFEKELKVGDFVYLCYGGNTIKWVGRVKSEIKEFDESVAKLFGPEKGEWFYREVDPLYFPKDETVKGLKDQKAQIMPSGYSTFKRIKPSELELINKNLFLPYFNLEVVEDNPPEEIEEEIENELEDIDMKTRNPLPLNLILFGPPGTGKTYSTIDISLETIDGEVPKLRSDAKQRFASLQTQRRVFFNTFHQNMSYEDFIEGIKPLKSDEEETFLKYEIQDGLFMQACIEAAYNFHIKNNKSDQVVEQLLDFNGLYDLLFEEVSRGDVKEIKTVSDNDLEINITSQGNFVLVHKGRERAYTVSRDRLSKIYEVYQDPTTMTNIHENIRDIIGGSNSTAYWAVLNKIVSYRARSRKKHPENTSKGLSYEDKKNVVNTVWEKRSTEKISGDKSDPYVFIIDEINRGNVSQIFGELITLIEPDKRMGQDEVLYVDLPYSKKSFAVPPNLFIIGTMNTADRSVEALDTALRRRFSFKSMLPMPDKVSKDCEGIDLQRLLNAINTRLQILKDSDHTIGHAWLSNTMDFEDLKKVYAGKILPLLQEFFYNDYEKLGLVLGDAFFEAPQMVSSNLFAKFTQGNGLASQYESVVKYKLKSVEDLNMEDFKSLYS
jgi:5-methylcytosine-specific restriction endonuclease McrBC GTP-binding regulatory subunit McrB